MDSDQHMNSDMSTISENNLGGVLFPDYGAGNLILSSDIGSTLSSFEGALCFDEANELVYVNMPVQMISSGINSSDPLQNSNSVFSSYSSSIPPLSDLSLFNDGGQVMLFTSGSIVIPNDDDNLVSSHSDPFVLEYVLNASQSEEKNITPSTSTATSSTEIRNEVHHNRNRTSPVINVINSNEIKEIEEDNIVKREIKHTCKLCSENFYSLRDYRKHLLTHKDHKIHQCKCCEASFNKINNLILHEVTHTIETKCPISSCQKRFNRKASLKAHIKLHEEDESLTCTECGEEFRNQLYLELHYKYQSQCRISNYEPVTAQKKTLVCKLCNRNFEDIERFNTHKKEHEKLKKALATKSHKKKVVPVVPNSRINRCKLCPKWFLKPSQLVRHMRIHTGERPFVCEVCNKAFNQANSLKIHMLKHTGDRPFQCPFCFTGFSQRGNLRQHINRVHSIPKVEENVYKCSECPCIFKKMCSLNAHKNRVHQQRYLGADEGSNDNDHSTKSGETAITIENGVDDVNDEDMNLILDKDSDINTISINFDNGNGTVCNQKVFVKKKGKTRFYVCSHCPKQNVKLREIIRHLKFSILGKPFKCDYCSKMFTQQSTFLTHLTLHATAKAYQCDMCDQSFSNPTEMKIHVKSHTEILDTQMCLNCLKPLSISEIENHECIPLISSLDENVNLESLDKRTEITQMVKVHDTASLILPPYDCKFCKITFESYVKLKQHLNRIHDAVICEICLLQLPNKERLKEHLVNHHEEEIRDRTCSKCNKKFRTKHRRDMHYKSHLKDSKNDVKCQLCDKTFIDKTSLNKHVKKVHESHKVQKSTTNDLSIPLNKNCDIDLTNELNVADPFTNGDVYVSCSTISINSEKIQSIDITNNGTFPVSDASAFTTTNALVTNSTSDNFTVNDSAIFTDTQIRVNENIESSVDLTTSASLKSDLLGSSSSNLPSQVLTLDAIDDNLFDFPSDVIPVEVSGADIVSSDNLNVAGAVIYKSTKCYQDNIEETDLQKQLQEAECNGDSNIVDSYFYACTTCYLTFKNLQTLLRHLQMHDGTKSFECLYCGIENKTQAQLTHHIAQHSLQKEFPCVHCGELFDSLEIVKKHITDIHLMSSVDKKSEQKRKKNSGNELLLSEKEKIIIAGQKPHKYSSISEKVLSSLLKNNAAKNSAKDLTSDKEEKSTKKKKNEMRKMQKENICSYCSRGFKKMCDLVRHIRIHTGEKPFKCDYCNKRFTVKSILNCHLKTHFSVNNIFCHVCNRFFATVGSLKTHMRLHTGERPYNCMYCKETFRTSGHRDSHQKRHLGDKDKTKSKSKSSTEATLIEIEDNGLDMNLEPAINIQDPDYIIPEMSVPENFKFQDIDLTDLSNLPSNKRTNSCAVCRKVFKKKSDLDRHMNTHMNEKGFHCIICDSKFNQLNTFKMHLRKHTNDQQWTCDVCNDSFASSKNLKIHKVRHHPDSLNLPIKDIEEKQKEVIESDKDVDKWCINAEIFADKAADLKKYDNVSDFYIIDKNFDLNSMMQDLFPDDEKD